MRHRTFTDSIEKAAVSKWREQYYDKHQPSTGADLSSILLLIHNIKYPQRTALNVINQLHYFLIHLVINTIITQLHSVISIRIPANTTQWLQPLDTLAFDPVKKIIRHEQVLQTRLGHKPTLHRQLDTFHNALHRITREQFINTWDTIRTATVEQLKTKSASNSIRRTKSLIETTSSSQP